MGFLGISFPRSIIVLPVTIAFLLISSVQPAHAIGISPPLIDITFEPGFTKTYSFYVRNTGDGQFPVAIKADGEFAEYIKPSMDYALLAPRQLKTFTVTIELPQEIEKPGLHISTVRAEQYREDAGEDSGTVSAYAAVSALIYVRVPYPGKYIETALSAGNINLGEPMEFGLSFTSRGEENTTVNGNIKVYDQDDKNIATLYFNDIFVSSKGSAATSLTWETEGLPAGRYRAVAETDYGGNKPSVASKEFKIGDVLLQIENITYGEIYTNEIAKFNLIVESYWNEEIDDVFVTMDVFDGSKEIFSAKSESFDIKSWASSNVALFWDVGDIDDGDYRVEFNVNYLDKKSMKTIQVEVKTEQDMFILIAILLIAVIATLLAVLIYRRKKRKKK